jgi:hypothetical protein
MSNQVTFDPSARLDLFFRIGRSGSKKLIFVDDEEEAYSIAAGAFQLNIKTAPGVSTNVIQLTEASGLTKGGAGNNELTIAITDVQSTIAENLYYYELYNTVTKKTWLSGNAHFYNSISEPVNSDTTVTIELDSTVTITIQDSISGVNGGTP